MRKRKRTCGWCFNVWKQKKDPSTCYRIASPDSPEENPEYPGLYPESPGFLPFSPPKTEILIFGKTNPQNLKPFQALIEWFIRR